MDLAKTKTKKHRKKKQKLSMHIVGVALRLLVIACFNITQTSGSRVGASTLRAKHQRRIFMRVVIRLPQI
jgi:hypothetical protein